MQKMQAAHLLPQFRLVSFQLKVLNHITQPDVSNPELQILQIYQTCQLIYLYF